MVIRTYTNGMSTLTSNPKNDILESRNDVARRVGCCTKTIMRAEARGELIPLRLSSRLVRYRRSDVDAWLRRAISR